MGQVLTAATPPLPLLYCSGHAAHRSRTHGTPPCMAWSTSVWEDCFVFEC